MSKIREAVFMFLSRPITEQFAIMQDFGDNPTWNEAMLPQRTRFLTGIRESGRVEEFCDYIIERFEA